MCALRVASAALLATAAVALATPAALADDGSGSNITSFGFSVSPSTVAPGGTVTLRSDSCEVPSVTVSSGVFDTVTLDEGRAGTATIDVEAKVGAEYQVTFDCKGEKGTARLSIAGGSTDHAAGDNSTIGQSTIGQSTGGDGTGGDGTGAHETGAHETGAHETGAHETGAHETGAHETGAHETGAHETGAHDTGAQKGVKAGFGGGAGEIGTTEVVAGTALIAGALGGAGVLLMRRRRTDCRN
ncbi:hypothetical protein OG566_07800 [Streptomyces sp. NBC_01353]|nr:hypothetical protein [Streptomyces sp. NBC_01353]